LQIIEQHTERLARLVDDMFTLARADAGNYPIQPGPMYLDELIEEVVRAARVLANRKHVSLYASADAGSAFTGDEELIRRMIVNLIDNAIRHAPAASTVAVSMQRVNEHYEIHVSDQGPGISSDAQPHIFERFYRSETARERTPSDPGGAGLGLAIVQWIARLHGGDVELVTTSRAGSTFRIRIPAGTVTREPVLAG
jgi:signal transduction histidine kinase